MDWPRWTSDGVAYYSNHTNETNSSSNKDKTPIVFIHGVGLRAESWYKQLPVFTEEYRCYAIDMPGHGESDLLPNPNVTLQSFANVLNRFINNVVGKPAIIVGHSLGAMTALQTAVSYPSIIKGVAALNAIYERPDEAIEDVKARAESLLNNLEQNVTEKPIARWFNGNPKYHKEADLCHKWLNESNRLGYARAYQMFANLRGITSKDLASITVPTLFLTGELDVNSKPEMSSTMADILPNGYAVIVPDSRHMTQMTHSNEVNKVLAAFFAKCE